MRKAERDHYDYLLKVNKNQVRKKWSVIRSVISKAKNSRSVDRIVVNGKTITDKPEIADIFNKYFVNIGPNLSKQISPSTQDPLSYIHCNISDSMYLYPVDCNEIENVISMLKNAGPGWDGIHSMIVKGSYQHYIVPLCHIFNLSFTNGIVPYELKVAKVMPLYEGDSQFSINNY